MGISALVVIVLLLWWRKEKQSAHPNIVLITIDTLRSDHCSAYGYFRETTPRMARVAKEGARFELVYSPTSSTEPSFTTLFTSQYPISHGVLSNGYGVPPDLKMLAEILKENNYTTAGFVSSFVLDSKFGMNQGFLSYDDQFDAVGASSDTKVYHNQKVEGGFDRRADKTTDKVLAWLNEKRGRPFFLWVHYFDPHQPYVPPDSYLKKFLPAGASDLDQQIAAYDGEIRFVDDQMGRVLDVLDSEKFSSDSLVIITADHGEGLKQHGRMGHSWQIYEEAIRVPLVFYWPGQISPRTISGGSVGLIDVTPTILEIAGMKSAIPGFQGMSLASYVRGEPSPDPDRKMYIQRRRYEKLKGDKFGIRYKNWKYIEAMEQDTRELYDLTLDPGELTNLFPQNPEKSNELSAFIESWKKKYHKNRTPFQVLSDEDRERLKALGYVQ